LKKKKSQKRAGAVTQGASPEFKLQYRGKKKIEVGLGVYLSASPKKSRWSYGIAILT
jgi:hypothetical protein